MLHNRTYRASDVSRKIYLQKMAYTASEYIDMVIMFGVAGENARAAARIYAERFPDRERYPDHKTILKCIQHLKVRKSYI